jgi:hypothetical protein
MMNEFPELNNQTKHLIKVLQRSIVVIIIAVYNPHHP